MSAHAPLEMKPIVPPVQTPAATPFATLQRKCACGGSSGASGSPGECPECKRKRTLQRRAAGSTQPDVAPPIVHEVLRSPGQPLDQATRSYFEPRFGHDFSKVRIHADARADRSARAVNALAYTVGRDIAFADGQYSPGSPSGRHLLAHELTHVVQQQATPVSTTSLRVGSADTPHETEAVDAATRIAAGASTGPVKPVSGQQVSGSIQRQADDSTALSNPGTAADPSAQSQQSSEGGSESQTSAAGAGSPPEKPEHCPAPKDLECTAATYDILHYDHNFVFPMDSSTLNAAQRAEIDAVAASWNTGTATGSIRLDGYASAEYECEYNWRLSCRRAQAVAAELAHPSNRSQGVPTGHIALFAHGESDQASPDLAPNRRVALSLPAGPLDPKDVPIPRPDPPMEGHVCGPDVTKELGDALKLTQAIFGGWDENHKKSACYALNNAVIGGAAWDILELHNDGNWIPNFRPSCASPSSNYNCESSVQVGSHCYDPGSVNYALFGTMCSLCDQFFTSIHSEDAALWKLDGMLRTIELYKKINFSKDKYAKEWATAGWHGWPTMPPASDRPGCSPTCPIPYRSKAGEQPWFHMHWLPYGSY
jgi:outer membrane protein OmpA-like peptidoglycan-associated protein